MSVDLLLGHLLNLRKYLIMNNLHHRRRGESNPCFLLLCPATSTDALSEPFQRRIRSNEQAWTYADVISIVITVASVWKHPKSQYWTACFRDQNGRQRRISTKETDQEKALLIAEEFERAAGPKRTLKQVEKVLDRLHEEVSGQRVVRPAFREYLGDWLTTKKAEIAASTMDPYQASHGKFVQFLGSGRINPSARSQNEMSSLSDILWLVRSLQRP